MDYQTSEAEQRIVGLRTSDLDPGMAGPGRRPGPQPESRPRLRVAVWATASV